jgi:hypothetical protein
MCSPFAPLDGVLRGSTLQALQAQFCLQMLPLARAWHTPQGMQLPYTMLWAHATA